MELGEEALVALQLEVQQDLEERLEPHTALGGGTIGSASWGVTTAPARGCGRRCGLDEVVHHHDERQGVLVVVHVLDDVHPLLFVHMARQPLGQDVVDGIVRFERKLALLAFEHTYRTKVRRLTTLLAWRAAWR